MADGSQTGSEVALTEQSPRANGLSSIRTVHDAVPTLDTARFEHMQRIATVMASSSLVPETLRTIGTKEDKEDLPRETVLANCFLVVNQSVRWGMDPFAVAQCCSVVHGRLCYEGKLVHAVLEAKLGVRLRYDFNEGKGDQLAVTVSGLLSGEGEERTVEGTVAQWKTTGANSPWTSPANWKRQLRYRGAREWARAHAPGTLLGVYSDDEMDDLVVRRARDITPTNELSRLPKGPPPAPPKGPPAAPAKQAAPSGNGAAPKAPQTQTPSPSAGPAEEPAMPDPIANPIGYRAHLNGEMGACGDKQTLDEVWEAYLPQTGTMGRDNRLVVEGDYEDHVKRVGEKS